MSQKSDPVIKCVHKDAFAAFILGALALTDIMVVLQVRESIHRIHGFIQHNQVLVEQPLVKGKLQCEHKVFSTRSDKDWLDEIPGK